MAFPFLSVCPITKNVPPLEDLIILAASSSLGAASGLRVALPRLNRMFLRAEVTSPAISA